MRVRRRASGSGSAIAPAVSRPARPYARGRAATKPSRGARALRLARNLLATSALILGAGVIGVVGGTSTLALWSDSATVPGSSVSSGTAGLIITGTPVAMTDALPGDTLMQPFTVSNTGDVALDITAKLAATSTGFAMRIDLDDSTTCPASLSGAALTTSAISTSPIAQLPPGSSRMLCAEITALPAVTPGQTITFDLLLTGTQHQ